MYKWKYRAIVLGNRDVILKFRDCDFCSGPKYVIFQIASLDDLLTTPSSFLDHLPQMAAYPGFLSGGGYSH